MRRLWSATAPTGWMTMTLNIFWIIITVSGEATVSFDRFTEDSKITGTGTSLLTINMFNTKADDILSDVVAKAAVESVESKLEKVYSYVGIVSGACSFTFNSDDTFSMVLGKRTLTGTYIYEASTHKITLEFATSLLKLGSMTGYAYIDGQDMDIVFDCNKLYNFLTKLGSKVSALGGIMKITESYDGMMLGFSLSK